jgi:hypothetical protein
VTEFVGGEVLGDDVTVMVVKVGREKKFLLAE